MFNQLLTNMALQRSLRVGMLIFIAIGISHYFSLSEIFWIPLVALFMLQTVVGLNMHKALQWFLIIILGVLFASYLVFYLQKSWLISILATIMCAGGCYFSVVQQSRSRITVGIFITAIILCGFILPCLSTYTVHARSFDVIFGGVIGLIASFLVFPIPIDVDFRNKMVLLLSATEDYLSDIIAYLFDHSLDAEVIDTKHQLEEQWKNFPAWIYEAGFVPLFQQGHRHFLVRLEQMRQILYVLHYLSRYPYDEALLSQLQQPMQRYLEKVQQLFEAVISVLRLKVLSEGVEDLSESFYQLEDCFNEILPFSLEGLGVNPEYVYLAELIDELKELGKMLLILAQALR
jgi:uncharacterized membrane protein YgaE (UPF0421/DUF939 family)